MPSTEEFHDIEMAGFYAKLFREHMVTAFSKNPPSEETKKKFLSGVKDIMESLEVYHDELEPKPPELTAWQKFLAFWNGPYF